MSHSDIPFTIEQQIFTMAQYVTITDNNQLRHFLEYAGYFRVSRYGKFLISNTHILKSKPDQDLLLKLYDFDVALRSVFYYFCKKAEVQFKSYLSNSVSIRLNNPTFYLDQSYYTNSKGENDKSKKIANRKSFHNFFQAVTEIEAKLKKSVNKYPELKDYRSGGQRANKKIPCWAAFSYFDFGTITNIYAYLRGDLRKEVLIYGYTQKNYGKQVPKQMDTWLDAIRNLRNICAHHNRLIGRTSSVVSLHQIDEANLLLSDTDLFSRIYALKKVLKTEDSNDMKKQLSKLVSEAKFDVFQLNILPNDWEERFTRIMEL